METPSTGRPALNIEGQTYTTGVGPQVRVGLDPGGYNWHTTLNSGRNGPGFSPNVQGIRKYNLFKRGNEENEKMKEAGEPSVNLLDGSWEALAEIPQPGTTGLLITKTLDGSDGYGIEVRNFRDENGTLYFNKADGGVIEVQKEGINDVYTFYTKKHTTMNKTRRQRGGFYPSVYGGISGAKMLTPLIARQMMRMYEHVGDKPLLTRGKTRKTKSKKLLRNKRA